MSMLVYDAAESGFRPLRTTDFVGPKIGDRLAAEPLGAPGVAVNVAISASASASVPLSPTCRRISMYATSAAFFSIGAGDQSVNSSSHYIAAGERLDFAVPLLAEIAVLRAAGVDGVLYITELL